MPMDRLLKTHEVGSEESERLSHAYRLALGGLRLVDRSDPICEIVACKVIEIGLDGSRTSQEIAALTIEQLGP